MSAQTLCCCTPRALVSPGQVARSISRPGAAKAHQLASSTSISAAQQLCLRHSSRKVQHSRRLQRVTPQAGIFGLGLPEVAVIAGVAVLIFGPSKLPELGKELGKSVKSFQSAAKEFENELKETSKPDSETTPADEKK